MNEHDAKADALTRLGVDSPYSGRSFPYCDRPFHRPPLLHA